MELNEHIAYLLRKTSMSRHELLDLHPRQLIALFNEVQFQESVEFYDTAYLFACLQATIATIWSKEKYEASDFIGARPERDRLDIVTDPLEDAIQMATQKGIKVPKYRLEKIKEEK